MDKEYESKVIQTEATYDYLKDEVHILYEENKELKQKYNIMKENAETLAKRIDKAINFINEFNRIILSRKDLSKNELELMIVPIELLDILKGEDKE